jgi:DNA mismatch repair protein MLH1
LSLTLRLSHREELFYQLGLRQFGRFVRIKLNPPPPLRDLIRLAVEHEEGKEAAKMSTEEITEVFGVV